MKKITVVLALLGIALSASAQTKPKIDFPQYKFTTELENPITSIKDQSRSGTCWAYSTISFVESEVIRINGITDKEKYPDFSEFFVVSHSYADRAAIKNLTLAGTYNADWDCYDGHYFLKINS